jgi:hypothetical protein
MFAVVVVPAWAAMLRFARDGSEEVTTYSIDLTPLFSIVVPYKI